jgi:2-polyprenyl-3-methyl-5-hydroxy-6-metoxy-1,4-benzoquinol methylase
MTWQDFLMLRCRHCGLVYSNRRQVPAELYDRAYEDLPSYHGYFAQAGKRPGRRHIAWAWRHFFGLARSRGRLLDIGCATGVFLNAAQERGWVSVGIDVSPIATRVAKELATGAEVLVGTVESCAFDDASFDAVTAWEVLEHVPDPKPFIAEILRILKPGGYLALSTPNWESPWERVTTDVNRRPPYHLTYWSPGPLTRLFTDCGFVAPITRRKPIAWGEEVGRKKWFYLPIAIMRSLVLDQKGNRLFGLARKPGPSPQKEPPLS